MVLTSLELHERVRIRSYSGPYFPAFGLNTETYSVFSANEGKYEPEKSEYGYFSRNESSQLILHYALPENNCKFEINFSKVLC